MSETTKLNERTRVSLLGLFQTSLVAKANYDLAAGHALAALGFDPTADNNINLDTGVITPAEPPKAE